MISKNSLLFMDISVKNSLQPVVWFWCNLMFVLKNVMFFLKSPRWHHYLEVTMDAEKRLQSLELRQR